MKRARTSSSGDQLTGGTKDVNPQYIQGSITLTAANTFTQVQVPTPIVRVGPQTGNTAIIMELIKLYVDMPALDVDAAAATNRDFNFQLTTVTQASLTTLADPNCLARLEQNLRNAFTAAGTGMLQNRIDPLVWDFTDGAGHGILVATDNIFVAALTSGQAGASQFTWKLSYRFKKVSLVEYIGIVQQQQ